MQELTIDYSNCRTQEGINGSQYIPIPTQYTSSSFKGSNSTCPQPGQDQWKGSLVNRTYDGVPVETFICSVQFSIPVDLNPPVLFYYRLTNFYQNHRRYVKSLDSDQLKGTAVSNKSLGACSPLDTNDTKPYYPCGLIANSLFNDSFSNPLQLNLHNDANAENRTYNMTQNGIAWGSDSALYNPTQYKNLSDIAVPRNWVLQYPNGYTENNPPPNLKEREDIQVWMRTAGLPNFSKLAKRNDNETMQCSSYRVDIDDSTCHGFPSCEILTPIRLPRHPVWRHKVVGSLHTNCDGRKESVPRNCLCGCWRHMHYPRHHFHSSTSHQATVCHL